MTRLLFVYNDPRWFVSHRLPIAEAALARGWEVGLAAPGEEAPSPVDGGSAQGGGASSSLPPSSDLSEEGPGEGSGRAAPPPPPRRQAQAIRTVRAAGLSFHPVPVYRPWFHPWKDPETLVALVRLYRRLRPDLVHHVTYKPIAHGSLAARLTGVPAVVNAVPGFGHVFTRTGLKGRLQKGAMKVGYRVAFGHPNQLAIFQNPEGRALFVEEGLLRRDRTRLIRGSGVDPERFRPAPEPGGPPMVLFASRMLYTKGVDDFVAAAGKLREDDVDARFVLAGEPDAGNLASVSQETLEGWDRTGAVEWWGHRDDMPEVLRRAAVVCLPSRYGEGLPRVLLEAAASGRPVVASDIPGCREIVRDGENGLLVPRGEVEALADVLARLLEDAELRRRMGRRGREIALEGFTLDRVVEAHMEVYDDLLNVRPGTPAPS